jgi:tetratricopeptide (TPR) repeat protein
MRTALVLLLLVLCLEPCFGANAEPDAGFQSKRQAALQLFDQGKRLEALPLLEEIAKARPDDDEALVALAASLIEHAATLHDEAAAGRERLRARDLLSKARDLGNASPLALNLSQLLQQLPASGAIRFSDDPRVEQAMRDGEAAFSRRDYADALAGYAKALALDPANYSAALFTANTHDRRNEFAEAARWYQRAIQLNPDVETAYRYYADMLARQGALGEARTMLIGAAVAEPYNRMVWRELHAWAHLAGTHINAVYVSVPGEQAVRSPAAPAAWQSYYKVRAGWRNGEDFRKRFPSEKEYRHSLPEESQALSAVAQAVESAGEGKPESKDPALALLVSLHRASLIEPYVLFSLGDAGIARDYAAYRARERDKLRAYLDKFVVPPR